MAATSSVNLKGTIDIATARRSAEIALLQIVGDVEVKQSEFNIPTAQTTPLAIPLSFSGAVAEALIVVLYAPKPLILELTSTDTDNSGGTIGPMRVGIKGHWFITLSPGEGIASIGAINLSTSEEVTLEVAYAAVENVGDTPAFWV